LIGLNQYGRALTKLARFERCSPFAEKEKKEGLGLAMEEDRRPQKIYKQIAYKLTSNARRTAAVS